MAATRFTAAPVTIGSWTIVHLPKAVSAKFPSRGIVMAEGTVNGVPFVAPLEPDGKGGHWLHVDASLKKAVKTGKAELVMEPAEEWPEPAIPADWKKALAAHPQQAKLWKEITPMARWDWIRWIRMSANPDTRKKHIVVALSKMKAGMRRPCCFNRSACTVPEVSKGGVLAVDY